jgi:molecular chaperone GrpE
MPDPDRPLEEENAGTPGSDPAPQAAPPETPEQDMAELLRQAQQKAEESHEAWLRAKAEADNVRKRAQIDLANAYKYATETLAGELLPVKDSLEAALATDASSKDALRSGVELTLKQLNAAFEKANLKEISPLGEKFDPHHHQAISTLPSEMEPNTVIDVLQKGYRLHDRVIRPALVAVAKPAVPQA